MFGSLRLPLPTSAWVRAALAPVLIFIAAGIDRNFLADFWHNLNRGRALATQGGLGVSDVSACTVPERAFQDANWLSQVFYYHLFQFGGLPLVQFVNALTLAAMMGLLVYLCRRTSGSLAVAAALGAFTFFGLWQLLSIRPQTFSLLLFVVMYVLLDRVQERPWLLAVLPVLVALWTNLHGAFLAGPMLIGCFGAAAAWEVWRAQGVAGLYSRHIGMWTLCLAASLLATLVNPYGWKIYQFVGTTVSAATTRGIDEWLPPSPNLFMGRIWAVSLVLALVAFALPRRPTARDVCLLACFLLPACGSVRMAAWWLLVLAPVVAAQVASALPGPASTDPEPPSVAAALFFGVLVLFAGLSVPGLSAYHPLLGAERRAGHRTEHDLQALADHLAARPAPPRIFSRFEWGACLTWSLAPRCQVFMDGWIDTYPDAVWSQYAAVTSGRSNWQDVLDRYTIDCLVLDASYHARTGLLPLVEQSAAWERVYQVGDAVLFVRRACPGPAPSPST
jgi:hypothetical protein